MSTRARLRRFRPTLDCLPSRLAPSTGGSPLDPTVDGWTPPPPTAPPIVDPLAPTVDGWSPSAPSS
jgi:hypothetical protein